MQKVDGRTKGIRGWSNIGLVGMTGMVFWGVLSSVPGADRAFEDVPPESSSFRTEAVGKRSVRIENTEEPVKLTARAVALHRQALVVDGHNDLPYKLRNVSFDRMDLLSSQSQFHTDIPRLIQGGVGAQFWAAYVPIQTIKSGESSRYCLEQMDLIHRMVRRYEQVFELAVNVEQIRSIRGRGKIACLIGIEGGHAIENSLALLRMYYRLGARYMTLTHNQTLDWADAATDEARHGGLTDFGEQVVREMNRLGMLIDISHVSADTMRDVLQVTRAPVIASHSSAFALHKHPRNVPDDVLQRLVDNGGVVMVNFYSTFLVGETRTATLRNVLDHIDHIVKVAGIDHVGLGSDFDGITRVPGQLEDVSRFPYITQGLLDRGYSDKQILKVLGGNLLVAFQATERASISFSDAPSARESR